MYNERHWRWLELTVRFIVSEHKVRDVKDAISRKMLAGFDAEGIGIASATYDIVGFPKLQIENVTSGKTVRENGDR